MFAQYNGYCYGYISNIRTKEIITRQEYKTDSGFTKDGDLYVKNVQEGDLSDIYNVGVWVSYNANLPTTPKEWRLICSKSTVSEQGVLLIFADGILPGWDVIDKNVCSKRVPLSDLLDAKVVYTYRKKDGTLFEQSVTEEVSIDVTDVTKYLDRYNQFNV